MLSMSHALHAGQNYVRHAAVAPFDVPSSDHSLTLKLPQHSPSLATP